MMHTSKTLSATAVHIGQDSDNYGLRSDMLEPSPRYTPSSPVSVDAGNMSEGTPHGTASLANLRPPKRYARRGFNELLD
jgi:hypothetical protein